MFSILKYGNFDVFDEITNDLFSNDNYEVEQRKDDKMNDDDVVLLPKDVKQSQPRHLFKVIGFIFLQTNIHCM